MVTLLILSDCAADRKVEKGFKQYLNDGRLLDMQDNKVEARHNYELELARMCSNRRD